MSSENQDYRRRPFSVNDLNRRTREVKIFNTTTITTTSATTSHDASISNTTTVTNRGVGGVNIIRHTDNNETRIPQASTTNVKKSDHRSKSAAFVTTNDHHNHNQNYTHIPYTTISTNSSITTPAKRKIRFVYGKEQHDPNRINVENYSNITSNTSNLNDNFSVNETAYQTNETLPKFPYVKTSTSTEVPNALIRNSVEINNQFLNDTYDNYENVNLSRTQETSKEMQVKDVEVECEIEEDPAIFEGSEGYVKNLISKIQTQYKNPETVHIKITRRQKPENIDKSGNLIKNSSESYGQIVRKEYYTIKSTNKPKKTSSISSFVDTSNIPYIDEENDSKNNSTRNSKIDEEKQNISNSNYIIEKHVIYGDNKDLENENNNIGVRNLVSSFGGHIANDTISKNDPISKIKDKKRAESFSPTRIKKAPKKIPKSNLELDIETNKKAEINNENKNGLKGFFKGIGGKIKAPEIQIPEATITSTDKTLEKKLKNEKKEKEKEEKKRKTSEAKDKSKDSTNQEPLIKSQKLDNENNNEIKLQEHSIQTLKVDVDIKRPSVDVSDIDINSADVKGGIKGFFKGIGGKIKAPEVSVPEETLNADDIHVAKIKGPKGDLPGVDVELHAPKIKTPKVDVNIHEPSIKTPKVDVDLERTQIKTTKVDVELNEPTVDISEIDINSADVKGGIKGFFKGIGGKIKAPEVSTTDVNLNAAVDIHAPKIKVQKGDESNIDVDVKGFSLKSQKHEGEVYIKPQVDDVDLHAPNIKSPKKDFDLLEPSGEIPDIDINSPDVKIGIKGFFKGIGGKIKEPDVSITEQTQQDLEIHENKLLKDPKGELIKGNVEFHQPLIKQPELVIDLQETPKVEVDVSEIEISSANVKGGLKGFLKGIGGKIKAPEVSTTDINLNAVDKHAQKIKETNIDVHIHGPSIKSPKVDVDLYAPTIKSPKLEVDLDRPETETIRIESQPNTSKNDVELNEPTVDISEIDISSADVKGGIKGFFKGIGGKIKAPEVSTTDVNLNAAVDIHAPKIKGPKVELPTVDIHGPSVKTPKVDVDLKLPEIKSPKADLDLHGQKIKSPKVEIDLHPQKFELEIHEPTVDVSDIDINSADVKGGIKGFFKGIGGKIKAPEVSTTDVNLNAAADIHAPKVKGPNVELPTVEIYNKPKVDIKFPKNNFEIQEELLKKSEVEIDFESKPTKKPKVDLELNERTVDISEIDISSADVKGGLKGFFKGIGGKIKTHEATEQKNKVYSPSVDVDLHGPSIKSPELDMSVHIPEIQSPNLNIDLNGDRTEIKTPKGDFEPTVDVSDIDINSADVKGGIKGFFKGIGGKIKVPEVDLSAANIHETKQKTSKVDLPGVDVELHEPKIKTPKVDVNIHEPSIKTPKVDVNIHEPSIKTPKVDVDLERTQIKTTKVDVELNEPTVDISEIDISSADVKGGIKGFFKGIGGKIKAPEVSTTDVNLNAAVDIHAPKIKGPKVELPTVDIHGPSVKTPKVDVDLKLPEIKSPKAEIDLHPQKFELEIHEPTVDVSDIDINSADVKGGIKGFFKGIGGKIKAPEVSVPDVDLNTADEPKFKAPKVELPNIDLNDVSIKPPKVETDLQKPAKKYQKEELDSKETIIKSSVVDVSDIDISSADVKGGLKGFFKGIGGKIKAPEVSVPAVNIKTNVTSQEPKFKSPKIDLPSIDLQDASINLTHVDDKQEQTKKGKSFIELKGPAIKIAKVEVDQGPTQPKVEVDLHDKSVKYPDLTESLDETDFNLADVKGGLKGFFKGIGGKIKAPEVSVPEIKLDVADLHEPSLNAPKVDLHSTLTKPLKDDAELKEPIIYSPKVEIHGPSIKYPNLDTEIHESKIDSSEIDIDSADVKGGIKGFFKGIGGKIKAPEVSVSEFNLNADDIHAACKIKGPKVDLPSVDVEIGRPSVKKTKTDVELQKSTIKSPKVDIELLESTEPDVSEFDIISADVKGGIKGFLKGIGGKINAPEVSVPDVDLNTTEKHAPKIKGTSVDVNIHEPSIKTPKVDADLSAPKIKTPKVDVELHAPKIKTPKVDVELNEPTVDISEIDISSADVKGGIKGFFKGIGGKIKAPDVLTSDVNIADIHAPKFKGPKTDFSFDEDLKEPIITSPKLDTDLDRTAIKTPKVEIELQGPTIKTPKIDHDSRTPSIKFPSLTADQHLPLDDVTEIDISSADVKGGLKGFFKGIGGKIKTPEVLIPDVKTKAGESHEINIKGPKVELPTVDIHGPPIKTPKVEVDLKASEIQSPNLNIDLNGDRTEIKTPKVDVELNEPTVDISEIDISSADVKGGIKGFFKGIGGKIKVPEVDLSAANIHETKQKTSKVDLPGVDVELHEPSIKTPKVDVDLERTQIKTTKVDVELNEPTVDISEIDISSADVKGGIKGFFKGIGGKIKAPEVSTTDVNLNAAVDIHAPKIKGPKVELPTVDIHGPSVKTPKVDVDLKLLEIKSPEFHEPKIFQSSSPVNVDDESSDVKGGIKGFFKGLGGRIKSPEIKIPSVSANISDVTHKSVIPVDKNILSSTKPQIESSHIDTSLRVPLDQEIIYGVDLPMTIVNNDWHWSSDSFKKNSDPNRKVFLRSSINSTDLTSTYKNSGTFNLGNLELTKNSELTTHLSKKIEVDHTISKPSNSGEVLEFELKRTKIKKDFQLNVDNLNNNNTSSIKNPGEITLETSQLNDSVTLPKSKSSTGTFFRRKLSSASSASNIDLKKASKYKNEPSITSSKNNRSESADTSNRSKIDYSMPRQCRVFTKPDFNGLGIHIACDKKSRRSPYIHDIEANSPGLKAGLKKHDFILEINGEDAVSMEFTSLIHKIQESIKENNLCLTVGNEKAYKKWVKKNMSYQKSK